MKNFLIIFSALSALVLLVCGGTLLLCSGVLTPTLPAAGAGKPTKASTDGPIFKRPTYDCSEEEQAKRKQVLDELIDKGFVKELEIRARGASIIVRDSWLLQDLDFKQKTCEVLAAYGTCNGDEQISTVRVESARTGKKLGVWGDLTGRLDLD